MSHRRVSLISSDRCLLHAPPAAHVEQPSRLVAILNRLTETGVADRCVREDAVPAGDHLLALVHTRGHIDRMRSICERGGGMVDEGDTFAVRSSFDAAARAAGAAVQAVDAVAEGRVHAAFCAVRPPGHHAERDRPMGFCLFNSVAVAARYARQVRGIERVAIVDWDVHHGNGTQHIFEDDPAVFYCSLHQYPFYPGTGARSERGTGGGEGATLNIPLPAGTGEREYLAAFTGEIIPALEEFQPGLLLISAGFDAHRDDPLGGMELEDASFSRFTKLLQPLAPIISVLEGGYHLPALAGSTACHLLALLGEDGTS
jgi:acetoin utilization deacetylase AcuC-like enzyme